MRAYEADGEVPVLGEVGLALALEHALHDRRDAGPHLSVGEFLGQLLLPCEHGQRLEHGEAVGYGTPDDGEGAFGGDEAFEDDAVLLHPLGDHREAALGAVALVAVRTDEVGVVRLLGGYHLEALDVHGLDDERVVVVEGEGRPVAVESVADVPLLHLAHGHLDAEGIVLPSGEEEEALLHSAEEEPVGVGRVVASQTLQLLDVPLLGDVVQGFPQGAVAPEETLDDVGGVHQRLSAATPPQVVGAFGVHGIGVSLQRPLAQLAALQSFGRVVVGQCEPGSDARHESSEALHVGHFLVAVVPRGREFQLHVLLERAVGHVLQHGSGHGVGQFRPVGAVALAVA